MPFRRTILPRTLALLLSCCLPAYAQPAQTSLATNAPAGTTLSTRVVAYTIDARVDAKANTVDATESLTYTNLTGQPLQAFPFHLYLNAFQPESSFTSETHFGGGIRDSESGNEYPDRKRGSITLTQVTADGFGDLTQALHFLAPDDGNANDRTVAQLALPRPIAPGEAITFHIAFHDRFPESIARNGYKRDFLMGGQWYPKLGVFWHGAWNCHQYHATTEFFSDFGIFKVRLTLPASYTVGATGVPTGEQTNPDGTRTSSFYAEDVHDFAWAASPHFQVSTQTYLGSMGPVQVRVLNLAAHPWAAARYMRILLGSLREFDTRYGPYPYKILTLIDPEPGSQIGGMEYPTLVTGDASLLDPTKSLEITAEHEFGHQYWYGMVATNEFEEAWLDEGINSYTETRVMGALEGEETSMLEHHGIDASDAGLQYLEYVGDSDYDPVTRAAWKFHDAGSYGAVTYGKSATLLRTLEGLIGQDTMDDAMRTYFMRYRFTHPTTEDFLRTIEEVAVKHGRATAIYGQAAGAGTAMVQSLGVVQANLFTMGGPLPVFQQAAMPRVITGSSLRPFFAQAVYGTAKLDYAIDSIRSGPAQWWLPKPDAKLVRSTVTVHRLGDFVLPVAVEVVFADGTRRRELWDSATDGNDRWHTYTYVERHGDVVSAEVDPDHALQLDLDRFNNSRVVKANPVPARKIANVWVTLQEFASEVTGWLV